MPAGLSQGTDAADIAAYVAGISGGQNAGDAPRRRRRRGR